MKRFHLFAGKTWDHLGGFSDFKGDFDTAFAARNHVFSLIEFEDGQPLWFEIGWYQIVDTHDQKVFSGNKRGRGYSSFVNWSCNEHLPPGFTCIEDERLIIKVSDFLTLACMRGYEIDHEGDTRPLSVI